MSDILKTDEKTEETQVKEPVEQSFWTVSVNRQLLFKKAIDGRTILLGMTADEHQSVAKVMDKAIDDIAEILKDRTTEHKATPKKEQVTKVEAPKKEDKEKETEDEIAKEAADSTVEKEPIEQDSDEKVDSKKKKDKKKGGSWSSMFD